MNTIQKLRQQIVEAGRRAYQRGYFAACDGNMSARIDQDRVLITATGISKGFMKDTDLVVVTMDGKVITGSGKPSTEIFMHLQIYKNRSDVAGVFHAHPPYATGYAVAGIPLERNVLPEVIMVLGNIPLVRYGAPGTAELYEPVLKLLPAHDAFLLANHGALTVGPDVLTAYYRMELVEHYAQIALIARQLGHVTTLDKKQVKKLTELRSRFGNP